MGRNCCHVSLASVLKILNFLQAFFGISIIIYSIWLLDQWNHRIPVDPPTMTPSRDSSSISNSGIEIIRVSHHANPLDFAVDMVSRSGNDLGYNLQSLKLPAPWFIYSFMGVGILVCIVTIIGFIAAEAINGCCLCFYSVLKTILILLETALLAFIAIDRHWEKDLPYDPTGALDSLRYFIEDNIDICKWVGIAVVAIQVLALLLAMVLRAMVSPRRNDLDEEDDYENPRGRTWDPLLNSQANQTSGSSKIQSWATRMKEKYGLNNGDK